MDDEKFSSIKNRENEITSIKMLVEIQQSESQLNCNRTNFFLLAISIVALTLTQVQMPLLQLAIVILGLLIALAWLLTQDRSSEYIKYWKNEVNQLSNKLEIPFIYPENIGGFQMRKVLYILPIAFTIFWIFMILLIAMNGGIIFSKIV
ncbi:hypothetical protein J2741_001484 [Methanolinea mesophila]|uniref:RipA family octameric membrane protein n=1 Tax=Methanolinea mesophila TaxID=547055 RepID=UPI001AE2B335|nr:hypothetical protein [Methanolinea mesophila]MBP1928937.1 hypothetical protein [Methanolinea mesophila]